MSAATAVRERPSSSRTPRPREASLLDDLPAAFAREELVLYYQPRVDMKTGAVRGLEALVRWQHPVHGLLSPDEFVPLVEGSERIGEFTMYVLDHALEQCAAWRRRGLDLRVAVNISVRNLETPRLPDEVGARLKRWNIPPSSLVLEVTESARLREPKRARNILSRLNAMGIRLSLDDFGTGYSWIARLKQLPVHELKIDKSFVMNMAGSRSGERIVVSMIDLAHWFDRRVVAEGIETEESWLRVAALGCDLGQGFHVSRPLPPEKLSLWLRDFRGVPLPGKPQEHAEPTPGPRRARLDVREGTRRRRWRRMVVLPLAAALMLGGAASAFANTALPGDLLYPLDRAVERVTLFLTPTAEGKAQVRLEQAAERLDEIQNLHERGDHRKLAKAVEELAKADVDVLRSSAGTKETTIRELVLGAVKEHVQELEAVQASLPVTGGTVVARSTIQAAIDEVSRVSDEASPPQDRPAREPTNVPDGSSSPRGSAPDARQAPPPAVDHGPQANPAVDAGSPAHAKGHPPGAGEEKKKPPKPKPNGSPDVAPAASAPPADGGAGGGDATPPAQTPAPSPGRTDQTPPGDGASPSPDVSPPAPTSTPSAGDGGGAPTDQTQPPSDGTGSQLPGLVPGPGDATSGSTGGSGAGDGGQAEQPNISIGPAAMEGDIRINPGDYVAAGYVFEIGGAHPATTVTFGGAKVTIPVSCRAKGSSAGTITISLAGGPYTVAENDKSLLPAPDRADPATFEGFMTAPDLCGGGPMFSSAGSPSPSGGATFVSHLQSSGTNKIQVKFHYRVAASKNHGNVNCADTASNPYPAQKAPCDAAWSGGVFFDPPQTIDASGDGNNHVKFV